MKRTLLDMTQSILSDMDSDDVNSINDTVEAEQVASVIRDTYYNIISTRDIPEHKLLRQLIAASDSEKPTHFSLPENVRRVETIWYKNEEGDYREVHWLEPLEFISRSDNLKTDFKLVTAIPSELRIGTTSQPCFYTAFDDENIVMDSFNSEVDSTLQQSKSRALVVQLPNFSLVDNFIPDIDVQLFPYLLAEAKSTAMSLFKSGSDPKIEQAARRQKSYNQNDQMRIGEDRNWSNYGRR